MWDRKIIKERGKAAFKANYWSSVAAAFIMGLFVTGATVSTRSTVGSTTGEVTVESTSNLTPEQIAGITAIAVGAFSIIAVVAFLAHTFIANPVEVGGRRFFKKNATEHTTSPATILEGFQNYGHVVVTLLLRDVFIMLWSLLFVVPGIMKAYSYRMVPYIVKDNPELSTQETLALSTKMMNGNRWQAFVMDLSFFGWIILGLFTLNLVNIFWTSPYMSASDAELYLELKNQA